MLGGSGTVFEENLEQRIERIRKRDEEIEKKHREAEADRLAALQANAMVKTSAPNDEDWPKAHKYDKLDFTYDVDTADIDAADERRLDDAVRPQRPFKKFADGEGPPADPSYNFLADSERDGKSKVNTTDYSKRDSRANNNTSPSPSSSSSTTSNFNRQSYNNNSFNRGKQPTKGRAVTKEKQFEDMRKMDRDRNNERIIQRQRSSEGNWRQEEREPARSFAGDRNRIDERPNKFRSDAKQATSNGNNKSTKNLSIQQRLGPKITEDNLTSKLSDLAIEKRGNTTVSVSKDGEVQSVKCKLFTLFHFFVHL